MGHISIIDKVIAERNAVYLPFTHDIFINLIYDPLDNYFVDEEGMVVYELFTLISTNDLYLFKHDKKDVVIYNKEMDVNFYLIYKKGDTKWMI